MHKSYLSFVLRLLFVISVFVIFIVGAFYVSSYIYPFIIAFVIAYLINPLVDYLTNRLKIPRVLSVLIGIIFLVGIFVGVISLLITQIISGSSYLADNVPRNLNTIITYVQDYITTKLIPSYQNLYQNFDRLGLSQQQTIINNIQNFSVQLMNSVQLFLTSLLTGITNLITALPSITTVFIISLLATFFISKDWHKIVYGIYKYFPERFKLFGNHVIIDLRRAIFGMLRSQLTIISITTLIVLIGLLILKIPYALTVAVITGIAEIIPFFGTGLIFVPWIAFCYLTNNIPLAIGLIVIFLTGIVVRQLVEPKILSSSIGLEPLPTLISIFVGIKLIGFIGIIIGPITLVILNTLHRANLFKELWIFIIDKKN